MAWYSLAIWVKRCDVNVLFGSSGVQDAGELSNAHETLQLAGACHGSPSQSTGAASTRPALSPFPVSGRLRPLCLVPFLRPLELSQRIPPYIWQNKAITQGTSGQAREEDAASLHGHGYTSTL